MHLLRLQDTVCRLSVCLLACGLLGRFPLSFTQHEERCINLIFKDLFFFSMLCVKGLFSIPLKCSVLQTSVYLCQGEEGRDHCNLSHCHTCGVVT